jgi:hypothetical protein
MSTWYKGLVIVTDIICPSDFHKQPSRLQQKKANCNKIRLILRLSHWSHRIPHGLLGIMDVR